MLRLLIKVDEKYGLARDLKEAPLGRQPNVLYLLSLFLCFIFLLVCFALPFLPFSLYMPFYVFI